MKNRKQILIVIGGIALALLLILSSMQSDQWKSDITPASQKKPKQNTPALFDSFL